MSRFFIFLGFLAFSIYSFGQLKYSYSDKCEEKLTLLVKGYPMHVFYEDSTVNIHITSPDSVIIENDTTRKNAFYIRALTLNSVHLEMITFTLNNKKKDTIYGESKIICFPVISFSRGELNIGNTRDGEVIDLNNLHVSLDYPHNYPNCLKIKIPIKIWSIQIESTEEIINGTGDFLSLNALNLLTRQKSGTKVTYSTVLSHYPWRPIKLIFYTP